MVSLNSKPLRLSFSGDEASCPWMGWGLDSTWLHGAAGGTWEHLLLRVTFTESLPACVPPGLRFEDTWGCRPRACPGLRLGAGSFLPGLPPAASASTFLGLRCLFCVPISKLPPTFFFFFFFGVSLAFSADRRSPADLHLRIAAWLCRPVRGLDAGWREWRSSRGSSPYSTRGGTLPFLPSSSECPSLASQGSGYP